MATITEDSVSVAINIIRNPDGSVQVISSANSIATVGGQTIPIRSESIDITPLLTAAQVTSADSFLAMVEGRIKTRWSIA